VRVTHASYMLHSDAFNGGGYSGTEYENALRGHTLLGYNYVVTKVAAFVGADANSGLINVAVTIEQIGVAPFYYPLSLEFGCPGMQSNRRVGELERLADYGSNVTVTIPDVPATAQCLGSIVLSLYSPRLFPGRTIKFAQGNGRVTVSLPSPIGRPETTPVTNQTDAASDEKPPLEELGETVKPPLAIPTIVPTNVTSIEFYYLSSKVNGTNQWVALRNGDVIVEAPAFGLSLEARPSRKVTSIWFTFESTKMKIEYSAPYELNSNSYLFSTGVKTVMATAYSGGQSVGVASLSFNVVAVPKIGSGLRTTRSKASVGDGRNVLPHLTKPVNYTAHGFNTPYAPSLLELVSLDRSANGATP
jgi:hypothetical protein